MTSKMKFEYLSSHWLDLSKILNMSSWDQTKVKKGYNEYDLLWKTTIKGRQPPMEDDLKIWKFEYLSSHWLNFPQIVNISSGEQTKVKKIMKTTFNARWPLMEDDFKIWKFEYLSSHWWDLPQILNIRSWEQIKVKKYSIKTGSYGRRSPKEDNLKIRKFEYLSVHLKLYY